MENIIKRLRVNFLTMKTIDIEDRLISLEEKRLLLMLGMNQDYDIEDLQNSADDCIVELNKILGEIRFLNRMDEMNFEVSYN